MGTTEYTEYGIIIAGSGHPGERVELNKNAGDDRLLVRELQEDPRASYAEIARRLNASETTIRRRIEALTSSGDISIALIPDLHQLGYVTSAYIGLKVDLDRLTELSEQIALMPEVTFTAITTGRYDFMFFVAERTLDDLTRFLSTSIAPLKSVLSIETIVTPSMFKGLSRDWRVPVEEQSPRNPPALASTPNLIYPSEPASLDTTDLALIYALQEDPRASYSDIARWVDVSQTTARRRIKALTDARVISFAVIPELEWLGYSTSAFIGIKADLTRLNEIAISLMDMPEVAFAATTMGRFDMILFSVQRSLSGLTSFLVETMAQMPGVRSTESIVTTRLIKTLRDWRVGYETERLTASDSDRRPPG